MPKTPQQKRQALADAMAKADREAGKKIGRDKPKPQEDQPSGGKTKAGR